MRPRPAWCWRKRGVRTREEPAQSEEERAQAKQEAELSVAPRLLEQIRAVLRGRVVSGDALYCQKALCRQIQAAGGDYLFAVKANQPDLLEDVSLLFRDPPPGEAFGHASTVDAHGGRVERRQLRMSAALASYLQAAGWVGAGLVLEVRTVVRWPACPQRPPREDRRYFLSSLPAQVSASRALALVRRHWHIENRLHWPRDVTLGEDASQVRSGHAPQVLSALRNLVVGVLHLHHVANLAAALRTHAWSPPPRVLSLLGLALRNFE
jgi:predicted transposase YbfD/YdcC